MINQSSHIKYFIAALLGCFFFCACENKMEDIDKFSKKEVSVEEGTNIESFLSNGGVLRAKLTAPVLLRYQTQIPRVEFTKSLHVDFYDSLKRVESQLFARYGEYKENENKVFLRDSVVVFNVGGDTLLTSELYWDQNKQVFYNDKPTVVIKSSPKQKLYSKDGLTADQNLQWFTLKSIQIGSFATIPDSTR
jgi:LPS export ABC transporter protein LptC